MTQIVKRQHAFLSVWARSVVGTMLSPVRRLLMRFFPYRPIFKALKTGGLIKWRFYAFDEFPPEAFAKADGYFLLTDEATCTECRGAQMIEIVVDRLPTDHSNQQWCGQYTRLCYACPDCGNLVRFHDGGEDIRVLKVLRDAEDLVGFLQALRSNPENDFNAVALRRQMLQEELLRLGRRKVELERKLRRLDTQQGDPKARP